MRKASAVCTSGPSSTRSGPLRSRGASCSGAAVRPVNHCAADASSSIRRQVAASSSADEAASSPAPAPGRRAALAAAAAALLFAPAAATPPPAPAAVTVRIKSKPKLQPARIKGGYVISVPDSYSVAYDRSDTTDPVLWFCGDFRTFETVSISRTPLSDLDLSALEGRSDLGGLSLDEVVGALLAETRDNQATFGFKVLAAKPRAQQQAEADSSGSGGSSGAGGGGQYYDIEYVHQLCRGITTEVSGGRRRCVSVSGDRDLQVVSRHYLATFVVRGGDVYLVKASAPSEGWPDVAEQLLAVVSSFGLPPLRA